MSSPDLKKRVACLELAQVLGNSAPLRFKNRTTQDLLEELVEGTFQIKELAVAAGDYRTALATIDSLCTLLQLRARLGGELHDLKRTDVLEPNLDAERRVEIANMYLSRHERSKAGGAE